MGRRKTTEEFIQRAKKVHGDKYSYEKADYINNKTKIIITCPEHGDFEQRANTHFRGSGCPECARIPRVNTEIFIQRAKKTHGDKYSYEKADYIHSETKIIITCPEHGDFEQRASDHCRGSGCPDCARNQPINTKEWIQRAKKVHGDKYSYEKADYIRGKGKVIITCPEHGDFGQLAHSHLKGSGCPECARIPRVNTEIFIQRAKKTHGDKYSYEKADYIHSETKIIIICPEHGDFGQLAYSHIQGAGCSACSGVAKVNTKEWIQRAKKVHGDKYSYEKTDYIGAHEKIIITCPEHGDFEQSAHSHLRSAGCPACAGVVQPTTEEIIQRAKKVHGDRFGYEKVDYINSETKIIITCPEHGDFEQLAYSHIQGANCPHCAHNAQLNTEMFVQRSKKIHADKYTYEKVDYIGAHEKVIITCPQHGDFEQRAYLHLQGNGCRKCYNKAEGRIGEYLNLHHIVYKEYRIEDRFFDYYLPEYNLIIERDGQQHYKIIGFFANGDENYLVKQQANDLYKTLLAKKYGHKITRIPYWLTAEQEEQEIANILAGNPTYPDVPDLSQRETKPLPGMFLPQPTNNFLGFVREL